jgi:predicted membrane-bound spermidine synthase
MTHLLVFAAGIAALSWEILWQIQASLSIGVSAMGTAITLAATMGGMAVGSLSMGRFLRAREVASPLRVYGLLELAIGLHGALLLRPGLAFLERFDAARFAAHPTLMPLAHLVGIALLLGPATAAMGATVPLFGRIAAERGGSISSLYAANTAGAAAGIALVSFAALPYLGVEVTGVLVACVDLLVALGAVLAGARPIAARSAPAAKGTAAAPTRRAFLVAFSTGFVLFGLEVAWFRPLRATFLSTTQAFAILLLAVLVPLSAGARLARELEKRRTPMALVLAATAAAALLATPLVERFDRALTALPLGFWATIAAWTLATTVVLGPAVLMLGTCLPRLLDERDGTQAWGRLYATNTAGSVLGSLLAAWALLPSLGFARTAWLLAGWLLAVALLVADDKARRWALGLGVPALAAAVLGQSQVGRTQVAGRFVGAPGAYTVLRYREGPDATVAVIDDAGGNRGLVIDGFLASAVGPSTHYMRWMGHLPMLLHPDPKRALVICFGTGQTADALRAEGPGDLHIVELSSAVYAMAPLFPQNHGVLLDPRVHPLTMDGRAFLRRTEQRFDVISLEPMAPNFAGVNALYSREFYELAAARLRDGGLAAQWVPFHLLSVHDARAIVNTFRGVFPDAVLWIDPVDLTGIVVGRRRGEGPPLGAAWPGLARRVERDLAPAVIPQWLALDARGLERYADGAATITDDNQLLAYGPERHRELKLVGTGVANLALVRAAGQAR